MRLINQADLVLNHQTAKASIQGLPSDDIVLCDASKASITYTLPPINTVINNNTPIMVKKIDTSANAVTVATAELIDGIASISLNSQGQFIVLVTNGSSWYVMGSNTQSVPGSGVPFFQSNMSANQGLTTTPAKVNYDTMQYDTENGFSTVNKRYTPNVPGYYMIQAELTAVDQTGQGQSIILSFYKNGSEIRQVTSACPLDYSGSNPLASQISALNVIQFNGTTDYVEIFAKTTLGAALVSFGVGAVLSTYFNGFFLHS